MKITMIHGQNHLGSTCQIARMLAEKLGGETQEFFLPRDFGEFCAGCGACFSDSETKCPHFEALSPLTRAIDQADVLILASPVYVYHVTGAMKAFLDHYGWRWMVHRPEEKMFSKQVVCISTAAGAGMKHTNRDMAHSAFFWGAGKIYRYGAAVRAVCWQGVSPGKKQAIEKAMERLARNIRNKQRRVKPGLFTRLFFAVMRQAQKRGWNQADANYWREKGWTGKKRPWK